MLPGGIIVTIQTLHLAENAQKQTDFYNKTKALNTKNKLMPNTKHKTQQQQRSSLH